MTCLDQFSPLSFPVRGNHWNYLSIDSGEHPSVHGVSSFEAILESGQVNIYNSLFMSLTFCIFQQLRHEHLVNLIEVFRRKKRLYLVFEFVDHTVLDDLERYPNGLDETTARKVLWQVLKGIEFCHVHSVSIDFITRISGSQSFVSATPILNLGEL